MPTKRNNGNEKQDYEIENGQYSTLGLRPITRKIGDKTEYINKTDRPIPPKQSADTKKEKAQAKARRKETKRVGSEQVETIKDSEYEIVDENDLFDYIKSHDIRGLDNDKSIQNATDIFSKKCSPEMRDFYYKGLSKIKVGMNYVKDRRSSNFNFGTNNVNVSIDSVIGDDFQVNTHEVAHAIDNLYGSDKPLSDGVRDSYTLSEHADMEVNNLKEQYGIHFALRIEINEYAKEHKDKSINYDKYMAYRKRNDEYIQKFPKEYANFRSKGLELRYKAIEDAKEGKISKQEEKKLLKKYDEQDDERELNKWAVQQADLSLKALKLSKVEENYLQITKQKILKFNDEHAYFCNSIEDMQSSVLTDKDIINGERADGWRHPTRYWEVPKVRGKELFAEMSTINASGNEKQKELIGKYLPRSYKLYNDIIEQVKKGKVEQ